MKKTIKFISFKLTSIEICIIQNYRLVFKIISNTIWPLQNVSNSLLSLINLKSLLMKASLIGKALNFGFKEYRFEPYAFNILKVNQFLNLINLNLTNKKRYITINVKTKKILELLKIFKKNGIISNFWKIKKSCFFIVFNFIFNSFLFSNIKVYATASQKLFLSYKSFYYIKGGANYNLIFLSTSRGILNFNSCLKKKISGFLFFKII